MSAFTILGLGEEAQYRASRQTYSNAARLYTSFETVSCVEQIAIPYELGTLSDSETALYKP